MNLLIPKLLAPREDDLSRGMLETIDMDSYRVEIKVQMRTVQQPRPSESLHELG